MKPINKEIFKIAIPNIIGNITVPLLGIVDTMLMGYEGENSNVMIGAIGLGGVIFNAIYWNFGALRVSVTGITAQAFGANDKQLQALTFFRALFIGAILAVIVLLSKSFIEDIGFDIIKNEKNKDIIAYAIEYFRVRIWAVPAVMLLYAFRGWFYGMQNAKYPLILTFVVNISNIIASIVFVKYFGMGAKGVALGTVIAQYLCLIVGFVLLLSKFKWVFNYLKVKALLMVNQLVRFFLVSGLVMGRNIMLFSVFSMFTVYSSSLGDDYLAINQILLQLFYLMCFAVDGFGYAAEAMVGKYTGENNALKLKETILYTMLWGVGFGALFAIGYMFFGQYFVRIFTPDWALINQAKPYLFWLSIISVIGSVAFIWDGIFIGSTRVVGMFISMTIATIMFFVALNYTKLSHPKHAIWVAMSTYMLVRGIIQTAMYRLNFRVNMGN